MLLRYFSFFVLRSYHFYLIRPFLSFGRRKKRNKKKREGGNNTTGGIPFFLFFFFPQQHKRRRTRTQDAPRDERRESPKKKRRRKKKPANQHQQKEEKKGAIVVFVFICIERLLSLWRLESPLRWTTTTRYYSRKRAALFSERVSWRKRERICAFFSKGDVRFFFLEILNDFEKETAFEI